MLSWFGCRSVALNGACLVLIDCDLTRERLLAVTDYTAQVIPATHGCRVVIVRDCQISLLA